MCKMQEMVRVVPDHRLSASWCAATSSEGQRVVFVRESDEWLIHSYCALGVTACPVYAALTKAA